MRNAVLFLILALAAPSAAAAQSRAQDSLAILKVLDDSGSRDPELLRGMYAPKAVWINSFGRRREGPDSIIAFLSKVVADPGIQASRVVRDDPVEVFFMRDDVAVVHWYHEREGQQLSSGVVIDRRIHMTWVLSREEGKWIVQYQIISDERDPNAGR